VILVNPLSETDPFGGVAVENMNPADNSSDELSGFATDWRKTMGCFDLF